MQPLISLQEVAVRYKRRGSIFRKAAYFEVLKSISFDVFAGETLGVIGKNGVGKSTLLQIVSGIILPNRGQVINRGVSVSLLTLQTGFDGNLSGRDNALIGGLLQGLSVKNIKSRLDEINEFAELGDFFDEPIRTYSNGMRARLGFAVATITSPDVLLVDEVLSVGDVNFRKKAEQTMVEKIRSQQTVVFVSHSPEQIRRLCNRVVLIDEGESVLTGTPDEVLQEYNKRMQQAKAVL